MQASLARLRERREELSGEGGFTLIELLIVIVILGILAAIVVFAVQNLTSTSMKASCQSSYKTVETAVEAYKAQELNYPSGSTTVAKAGGGTVTGTSPYTDNDQGAPVTYTTGSAPTITNAAAATAAVNAAGTSTGAGSELLVAAGTAPNTSSASDAATTGPWLKDIPQNSSHYSIFVANDGSGTLAVLDGAGKVVAGTTPGSNTNDITACSNVK